MPGFHSHLRAWLCCPSALHFSQPSHGERKVRRDVGRKERRDGRKESFSQTTHMTTEEAKTNKKNFSDSQRVGEENGHFEMFCAILLLDSHQKII